MNCEICGAFEEKLIPTEVDGSFLNLCSKCSKYGKPLNKEDYKVYLTNEYYDREYIKPDYPEIIKNAMLEKGLSLEELAGKLKVPIKDLKKIIEGRIIPNNEIMLKLQKHLKVNLLETSSLKYGNEQKYSDKLSFGDVVNIKHKKAD